MNCCSRCKNNNKTNIIGINNRTVNFIFLFLISVSFFIYGCGLRKTELSGRIDKDTVLDKARSPYRIISELVVAPEAKLTIEPGVKIYFAGNIRIIIEGTLIAIGKEDEKIVFASEEPDEFTWHSLYFRSSAGRQPATSHLSHCIIQNAKFGIYCDSVSPEITFSVISANETGIHLWSSNAKISNNIIIDNTDNGIYIGSMQPTITNNIITRNRIGIYCDFNPNPIISNNRIYQNHEYAIYLRRTATDIPAPNNWWGTTNLENIRKSIYDKNADTSLGNVFINPILSEPPGG